MLEDVSNNVMVDAFLSLAQSLGVNDSKGNPLTDANTLSTTNGFRFDIVILGSDEGFSGEITVGDLYDYYPIGAATALAEYSGGRTSLVSSETRTSPGRKRAKPRRNRTSGSGPTTVPPTLSS